MIGNVNVSVNVKMQAPAEHVALRTPEPTLPAAAAAAQERIQILDSRELRRR